MHYDIDADQGLKSGFFCFGYAGNTPAKRCKQIDLIIDGPKFLPVPGKPGIQVEKIMFMEGACVCGATRYKVTGPPLSVHACHCTDCQALSGSAFGLSMVLNRENVELLQGTLDVNKFSTSHNKMHRHHCPECGTAIWFSSPDYPGIVALKPGTLNDTSTLSPIAHVWYRSAQPWLDVGNNIPVYEEQPPLSELLELAAKEHEA